VITPDFYASQSRLRLIDPGLKLFVALPLLGICLWADSIVLSIAILIFTGSILVKGGGVPLRIYMKLVFLPISFLLLGTVTIALAISDTPGHFFFSFYVFGKYVGFTEIGILQATHLFFKALAAVSCLFSLSLTTPITDLEFIARRFRVPGVLVEMTGLVYRFIFLLLDSANTMRTAQLSRLGYSGFAASFRSLASLSSSLFVHSLQKSEDLFIGLESRGYTGNLTVSRELYESRREWYAAFVVFHLAVIAAALFLQSLRGNWW
jgi:cobalt/nickel transport system permease protein